MFALEVVQARGRPAPIPVAYVLRRDDASERSPKRACAPMEDDARDARAEELHLMRLARMSRCYAPPLPPDPAAVAALLCRESEAAETRAHDERAAATTIQSAARQRSACVESAR